jgi:hypothetical protein
MLNSQKSQLMSLVQANGLEPTDFVPSETKEIGRSAFTLRLAANERLYFSIYGHPSSYDAIRCVHSTFSPRFSENIFPAEGWADISIAFNMFSQWLSQHVRRYLEERSIPDPWTHLSLRPEIAGITIGVATDTAFFTPPEQVQIRDALQRFRNLTMEEFTLTRQHLDDLDGRISYLSEAVQRVSRFDWTNLALASLVTIATALSLDIQQDHRLAELFKEAFAVVAGLLK